ncbi:MAG: chemotaxis protein CheR, partial [Chloroflexi bacterium]|nr:chemotaxis protein CheR [Chloroflexota bacterium]
MTTLATSQFETIAELARERWGLNLTDRKQGLVANRLGSFLRKSPFADVAEYLDHLKRDADEEDMLVFFDLLSTNVTSFFRERQHFDYLEREFWTPLARGNITTPNRRIRIWSAACSTGPEAY